MYDDDDDDEYNKIMTPSVRALTVMARWQPVADDVIDLLPSSL